MSNFVVIAEGVPHTFHGGGGVTVYSAVRAMLESGHRVTVVALRSSEYNGPRTEADHIAHLEGIGAEVILLRPPTVPASAGKWQEFFPDTAALFPGALQAEEVAGIVSRQNVDGIFMYHWDSIAAGLSIRDIPKLGLVGDPIHLPQLFRRIMRDKYSAGKGLKARLKEAVRERLLTRSQMNAMCGLLKSCDASGAFAAHHAEMFKTAGVPNVGYYRTPTPDPLISHPVRSLSPKFKIMHIGHMRGTATVSGIEVLAEEILPILKLKLPNDSFEIHLVGGYFETLPEPLRRKLSDPHVKVRGQISPPDEEFLSSHLVLVPTPIDLGIRVRIITAFSFGSCVIAHLANKAGIPELTHGENCLLGSTGADLARYCMEIFENASQREALEARSRETYDRNFSLNTAGARIAEKLGSLSKAVHPAEA